MTLSQLCHVGHNFIGSDVLPSSFLFFSLLLSFFPVSLFLSLPGLLGWTEIGKGSGAPWSVLGLSSKRGGGGGVQNFFFPRGGGGAGAGGRVQMFF